MDLDVSYYNTISPIDNRYYSIVEELHNFFSYKYWINYRIIFEFNYLLCLLNIFHDNKKFNIINKNDEDVTDQFIDALTKKISKHNLTFSNKNIDKIISIEEKTLHDIKAIEYYIKQILGDDYLPDIFMELDINLNKQVDYIKQILEYIHFGLTSQDVNSVSFTIQNFECLKFVIIPTMKELLDSIDLLSKESDIIICGYTHGQPAVPTNMMKEINVFMTRLLYWFQDITSHKHCTKFGGAVGNLNAHYFCFPNIDWSNYFADFLKKEGIERWKYTTQITNYDDICKLFGFMIGFNTVLIDLCQDIWLYISKNYFILNKENDSQVGSSTMPQKVNPIDFENAEGNLKLANSGFHLFIDKLLVSRLQRDLTDSTILRSVGSYFAYTLIGYKKIIKGLGKLQINKTEIEKDLHNHPEILSEGVQSILRMYNVSNAYDIVRKITQNKKFNHLNYFKENVKDVINK